MASLSQIFSEVALKIDSATMPPKSLARIVHGKPVKVKREGANTVAIGPFQDIEDVYMKIVEQLGRGDPYSTSQEEMSLKDHAAAGLGPAQSDSLVIQPVKVDSIVMDYIQEKKSKELQTIEKRSAVSINLNKSHVSFTSKTGKNIHAQFAREQFITLYQKTATGLQTRVHVYSPKIITLCSEEFPELLINTDKKKMELTGSFISLERLETFLKESAQHGMGKYSQHQTPSKTRGNDIPYRQSVKQEKSTDQAKDETCPICLEPIKAHDCEVLSKCKHKFCKGCLAQAFLLKPTCPICGEIYGSLTGTQPRGGTMTVSKDRSSLPGYEKYGTIAITYYIPSGHQGNEHPNPGTAYMGVSRIAYLPDSIEGNHVLKLLRRAFDQRLTFTIGYSSTTGKNNMVTWNDIHHKTSRDGGPTHYGYPDPDYLKRVQDELKAKGIY